MRRARFALAVAAVACMIVGCVFMVVNDPHLPYGERKSGWESSLFIGGAMALLWLWISGNHRRWAAEDRERQVRRVRS